MYRMALRATAAVGVLTTERVPASADWILNDFLSDVMPGIESVSVLMGSPAPTQKVIVQVWDGEGRVVGYVKYAEKPAARQRLEHEHRVLAELPRDVGPQVLKYGSLGTGTAMLITPLPGQLLPPSLPPDPNLSHLCRRLITGRPVPVDDHPWLQGCLKSDECTVAWIDELRGRTWPVAVQHGDLVWNLQRAHDGTLRAFDWEYATLEGFPGQDLANYLLQVAMEMNKWSPEKSHPLVLDYFMENAWDEVTRPEALSILRLAAFDVYRKFEQDGYAPDSPEQSWRRTFWSFM
jgi:hypothetical protein